MSDRSFLIQIEDTSKESENQTCVTRRTKEDNCFGRREMVLIRQTTEPASSPNHVHPASSAARNIAETCELFT